MQNVFSWSRNKLLDEIKELNSEVERLQKYEKGYRFLKLKNDKLKKNLYDLDTLLTKTLRKV